MTRVVPDSLPRFFPKGIPHSASAAVLNGFASAPQLTSVMTLGLLWVSQQTQLDHLASPPTGILP